MGVAERREREKEQRRNDIIDAAEKIFFAKGINTATMDEVAEEAELSKGTLYLYFKSKEELYLAINTRGLAIMEQMFLEASKKGSTGLEKANLIGDAYFQFYQEYPDYFDAMIYYDLNEINLVKEAACAVECHKHGMRTLQIVAEAVAVGTKDGSIRPDLDPMLTAMVLWGHSTGMIQVLSRKGGHLQEEHGVNVQDVIELSWEMLRRSLTK